MTTEIAPAQHQRPIIKVMIADDSVDFCKLLEMALNSQPDMRLVRSLHRADTILDELERLQPDVLVLDLSMPGKQPLVVIGEAAHSFPNVRIIAFSAHDDQQSVDRALVAGAAGYVFKMQGLQALIAGVRKVAAGISQAK